jgi:hypothetical protein
MTLINSFFSLLINQRKKEISQKKKTTTKNHRDKRSMYCDEFGLPFFASLFITFNNLMAELSV